MNITSAMTRFAGPMLRVAAAAALLGCAACEDPSREPDVIAGPLPPEAVDVTAVQPATAPMPPDRPWAAPGVLGGLEQNANEVRPMVTGAVALLHPARGEKVSGEIRFDRVASGVRVEAIVRGLAPGQPHAFHVHVLGDCTGPALKTAGPHFNFVDPFDTEEKPDRILGNLGELEPGQDGTARLTKVLAEPELNGPASIVGRSVVVHARGNEPGPPPGSQSGARVACGVIGIDTVEGR